MDMAQRGTPGRSRPYDRLLPSEQHDGDRVSPIRSMTATEPSSTPQRSTIRDVALEAGVSTATVSRVLNRSPNVSAGTRAVVLEAMERHGFTARRRRSRTGPLRDMVAVRCPYLLTDYFGVILSAVARSLRLRGKGVLLSAEAEEGDEASLAELLRAEMTEGAVLI